MPVRATCPHCQTPCLVADQHVKVPVKCSHCSKVFTAQASPASAPLAARTAVSGLRLDVGSATSVGRVRKRNEDSFLVQHVAWSALEEMNEIAVLAIADGMGGEEAGHEASCLVVQTIGATLTPLLAGAQSGQLTGITPELLKAEVEAALKEANRKVLKRGQSSTASKGMGAAVVLVLVWNGQALIGHVGDCRVYLLRAGKLVQVTQDHTLVARMVQLGQLSAKEAENHPRKNELTQAIGKSAEVKPSLNHVQLTAGDCLVVACDGLHADLDERKLVQEMIRPVTSASERARRLVDSANDQGGSDNCTVIAMGYR